MLIDNWNRPINYLRIAVTDRCNLRCFYCMPEEGINYLPRKELLTYEELIQFTSIVAKLGVNKIRITGGEPFLRKDLTTFISNLNQIPGIDSIHITTNGVLAGEYIHQFEEIGIKSVNLSLDTLDKEKFKLITRRDELDNVMSTLDALVEKNIKTKINMVVMDGKNTNDILPMIDLSKRLPVDVRLIEEMPFNGEGAHYEKLIWDHSRILQTITQEHSGVERVKSAPNSTAVEYNIPGFQGKVGIIPAFTRTFCGTCNRIRLTAQGTLRTCLYTDKGLNVRELVRSGYSEDTISSRVLEAIGNRHKDGYEAEKNRSGSGEVTESMSTIGG